MAQKSIFPVNKHKVLGWKLSVLLKKYPRIYKETLVTLIIKDKKQSRKKDVGEIVISKTPGNAVLRLRGKIFSILRRVSPNALMM